MHTTNKDDCVIGNLYTPRPIGEVPTDDYFCYEMDGNYSYTIRL